jgi:predicted dehydrogenase
MGRWHAHALSRIGIPVTAVVDSDARRARHLGAQHPQARLFEDLASLLSRDGADVVHVCTPLSTHRTLVGEVLQAGRHVLVEKPLAETAAETATLQRLAEARGVLLCPVHQFLFQPGALYVQRALDKLGPIRHMDFTACSAGAYRADDAGRAQVAADILPHPLSLLTRFLAPRLTDLEWYVRAPLPGEIRVVGAADGVTVSILVSVRGRPTTNTFRLVGERGTAHLDLFHGFAVVEPGAVSRVHKILHPFALSGRVLIGAAGNLVRRSVHREPAYPGLRELTRRFYAAASGADVAPIHAQEVLEVAETRDRLLLDLAGTPAMRF